MTTTFGSRDASCKLIAVDHLPAKANHVYLGNDTVPLISSALEESLGTVAASMPALRHTFNRFLHSPGSSKSISRTYGKGRASYHVYDHDHSTFKNHVTRGSAGFSRLEIGENILLRAPDTVVPNSGVLQTVSFDIETQRASDVSGSQRP